ncbi:hypothetical protein E8E13_006451 [Curvularia kusanoi]|uniref:Uncharacterized protein n=1 Tax=Curvularia kusanoi TaxID=90978 RepID=A0A9P4TL82_CURKU|nr:hypothetical protein E8E13_006451 [Curvularia kusanoi]
MGHVAVIKTVKEDATQQHVSVESAATTTQAAPITPNDTPESTMTDANTTKFPQVVEPIQPDPTPSSHNAPTAPPAAAETSTITSSPTTKSPPAASPEPEEDPYASLAPDTPLAIQITNPSAFPIQRLREVQAQYQPSTHITNMLCHKTPSGPITQVTADVQDGSVNHLLIRDPRIIRALGLTGPAFDTIHFDSAKLRLDETFNVRIFPGQKERDLDAWIVAELVSARHAYLVWLDERGSADPKAAPYAAEAKAIARLTERRWPDVMREIEGVWRLEHGEDGSEYRENRRRYLGEDPTYPEGAEENRVVRSMFG